MPISRIVEFSALIPEKFNQQKLRGRFVCIDRYMQSDLFFISADKGGKHEATYYRARDAPWQLNNKTKRVVLCVWISVHRKRPFFYFPDFHTLATPERRSTICRHQPAHCPTQETRVVSSTRSWQWCRSTAFTSNPVWAALRSSSESQKQSEKSSTTTTATLSTCSGRSRATRNWSSSLEGYISPSILNWSFSRTRNACTPIIILL